MNAKQKLQQVVNDLKAISQSENVYLAKEKAYELSVKWEREAADMFDDKENRIIFAIAVTASLLIGFLCGTFL